MSFPPNQTPTQSPLPLDGSTLVPTISAAPDGGGTAKPTLTAVPTMTPVPSVSPRPTDKPTFTAQPTVTPRPTITATPTAAPSTAGPTMTPQPTTTRAPTERPTFTALPTTAPSPEPTPTLFLEKVVFTCNEQGQVALATPPYSQVTAISFEVVYLVETLSFFDQYQADLEARILADSVQGALNCGPGVFATEAAPTVPMQTILMAETCQAQISSCSVLQSAFVIVVEENVSPEATAFLGYVKLSNDMPAYPEAMPVLDRVEYLRPLLFPPLLGDGGNQTTQPPVSGVVDQVDNNVNVSPYTLGAVLAVCVGGVAALGVWARNRQLRNEQHMQLLEDISVGGEGEVA